MDNKIYEAVIATVDDWQVLYLDGESVAQNHRVQLDQYLGGKTVFFKEFRDYWESDEAYTDEHGQFPETLQELLDFENTYEKTED